MGSCVYSAANSPPNTKCTTFSQKLMLGKTLDGEFKLLRIRELDKDDVDDKPGQRVMVQCEAVASDQIQVNVMQESCTGRGQM